MEDAEFYFSPSLFLGKAEMLRPEYPILAALSRERAQVSEIFT